MRAVAFTDVADNSGGRRMALWGVQDRVCALVQVTGNRDP